MDKDPKLGPQGRRDTVTMGLEMRQDPGSQEALTGARAKDPARILMLVPHEPELDPRIRWVTQLCAEFGPTDIIASVSSREIFDSMGKPAREYKGNIYLERIDKDAYSSKTAKCLSMLTDFSYINGAIRRFMRRENLRVASAANAVRGWSQSYDSLKQSRGGLMTIFRGVLRGDPVRMLFTGIDHKAGAAFRFLSRLASYTIISSAVYRRARALSIIPRVVICHDIYALAAAVKLKKLYGCPLIYDSHEFWPEADLLGQAWQRRLTTFIERKHIRHADAVVSVSPQLVRCLAKLYGISKVLSAPNAEPRAQSVPPAREWPGSAPIKVLFQGQADLRRGIEELLAAWNCIEAKEAVLYLRCPENGYFAALRKTFSGLFDEQKVIILEPVPEKDLISAAAFADVGIIPYVGPSLNHVYCCPNKLSQYMQAGLAVLSNELEFISEVINRFQCGLTYDARKPETLIEAIRLLIADPKILQSMQHNAYHGARSEFNWEVQSLEYKNAIREQYFRSIGEISSRRATNAV